MHSFAKVLVASFLVLGFASAGIIDYGHHDIHEDYQEHHDLGEYHGLDDHQDYHSEPKYQFNYAVHDPHTGDEKQHLEERNGDTVKGTYTLKEADGTTRVVEYHADKHNGFHATVHKIGEPKHQPHYEDLHHHHF